MYAYTQIYIYAIHIYNLFIYKIKCISLYSVEPHYKVYPII